MALFSLFFQTRAKLNQLDIDASIQENHEASASVTSTEVEDGSLISDHIILNPKKLTIEGMISKTPLGSSALVSSAATAAGGAVGKALGGMNKLTGAAAVVGGASIGGLISNSFGLDSPGGKGKSRLPTDIYDYLVELRDKKQPFDVVTALKRYSNMVLLRVSAPRTNKTTGALHFTAELEEIRIVSAQTADFTGVNSSLGGAAGGAAKLGKQAASKASESVSDNSSLLFKGYKALTGGG